MSVTTRQPRPGETDGVHYHFISQEAYDRLVKEDGMLEHAVYSSASYGTPRRPVEEHLAAGCNVVLEIDVQGAFQVKEKCPDALMIFILPPSLEVLRHRLVDRNTESPEAVERRMGAALQELEMAGRYDYQVCLLYTSLPRHGADHRGGRGPADEGPGERSRRLCPVHLRRELWRRGLLRHSRRALYRHRPGDQGAVTLHHDHSLLPGQRLRGILSLSLIHI